MVVDNPDETNIDGAAPPSETTQKPVKGALGNRKSKGTDQRLALGRSVQGYTIRTTVATTKSSIYRREN